MDINSLIEKELGKNTLTNVFIGGMDTDTADQLILNNQYRYAENIRISSSEEGQLGNVIPINGVSNLNITYSGEEQELSIVAMDSIKNYVCLLTKSIGYDLSKVHTDYIPCHMYIISDNLPTTDYDYGYAYTYTNFIPIYLRINNIYSLYNSDEYEIYDEYYYYENSFVLRKCPSINCEINFGSAGSLVSEKSSSYTGTIKEIINFIYQLCVFYLSSSEDKWIKVDLYPSDILQQLVDESDSIDVSVYEKIEADAWNIFVNDQYGEGSYVKLFGPCTRMIFSDENKNVNIKLRWLSNTNVKIYISSPLENVPILSANITQKYIGSNINMLGVVDQVDLYKPDILIVSRSSGHLSGTLWYWCYVLYKDLGSTTAVSPITSGLSPYNSSLLDEDCRWGVDPGTDDIHFQSNWKVNISMDYLYGMNGFNKIKLYRISYGTDAEYAEPQITVVYDDLISNVYSDNTLKIIIVDDGSSSESVSIEEFLAQDAFSEDVRPRVIEIKNDRMYAASISYKLEAIDKLYDNIDTICITSGNSSDPYTHQQFTSENILKYNEDYWKMPDDANTIGGKCEFLQWTLNENVKTFSFFKQGLWENCFKPEEEYRFAIIFHDKSGLKTNPKWICDIMFPKPVITFNNSGFNQDSYGEWIVQDPTCTVKLYGVTFLLNVEKIKQIAPSFSGYEIVLQQRTEDDKICIAEGFLSGSCFASELSNVNKLIPGYLASSIEDTTISGQPLVEFFSPESSMASDKLKLVLDKNANGVILLLQRIYNCYNITSQISTAQNQDVKNVIMSPKFKTGDNLIKDSYGFFSIVGEEWFTGWWHSGYSSIQWNYDTLTRVYEGSQDYNDFSYRFSPIGAVDFLIPRNVDYTFDFVKDFKIKESLLSNTPDKDYSLTQASGQTISVGGINWNPWSVKDHINRYIGVPDQDYYSVVPCFFKGKCMLLNIDGHDEFNILYRNENNDFGLQFPLGIVDLKIASSPYGGYNKTSILNAIYYSFGAYNPANTSSIQVTNPGTATSFGIYTFNYKHMPKTTNDGENEYDAKCGFLSLICAVPIFSDLNAGYDIGLSNRELTSELLYSILPYAGVYDMNRYDFLGHSRDDLVIDQTRDDHTYPFSYSAINNILIYQKANNEDELIYTDYRNRIYASDPSFGDEETSDNFLRFSTASDSYINIDTKPGDITALMAFKNRLYFWQQEAFGTVDTNERALVTGATSAQEEQSIDLILGEGNLLSRYDYISQLYGSSLGNRAITQSDEYIYWWDSKNKEILQFDGKSVIPISTTKTVKKYILSGEENLDPYAFYDPNNKEVIFNIVNGECLVYNEYIQRFTSIYKINPTTNTNNLKHKLVSNGSGIFLYDDDYDNVKGFQAEKLFPKLKYIVNKYPYTNKTFDNGTLGGNFYQYRDDGVYKHNLQKLKLTFSTNLNQYCELSGTNITDREFDFRYSIPRDNTIISNNNEVHYGNRMRGKVMECEISSNDNSTDFSLQYITTKFRTSWS